MIVLALLERLESVEGLHVIGALLEHLAVVLARELVVLEPGDGGVGDLEEDRQRQIAVEDVAHDLAEQRHVVLEALGGDRVTLEVGQEVLEVGLAEARLDRVGREVEGPLGRLETDVGDLGGAAERGEALHRIVGLPGDGQHLDELVVVGGPLVAGDQHPSRRDARVPVVARDHQLERGERALVVRHHRMTSA